MNRSPWGRLSIFCASVLTTATGCSPESLTLSDDSGDGHPSSWTAPLSTGQSPIHYLRPPPKGAFTTQGATSSAPVATAAAAAALATPISHVHIAWEFRGQPGGAARIAGCKDGSLFALNGDKSLWRNTNGGTDTSWTFVANLPRAQDITCSEALYVFNADRSLWGNIGTMTALNLRRVGQPGGAKQVTFGWRDQGTLNSALFALNDDNSFWVSASGIDGSWINLGQPANADRVSAGKTGIWLFKTDKTLYRGNGLDSGWAYMDTPSVAMQISDDGSSESGSLWALNTDHNLYHGVVVAAAPAPSLSGIAFEPARGTRTTADRIAGCADGSVYSLDTDKSLWRNTNGGANGSWVRIGTFSNAIDITCSTSLYVFNNDRSLWHNVGTPTSLTLTRIGGPGGAKQISAGWGVADGSGTALPALFALNDDQRLFQSKTGADGTWLQIGAPGAADRISAGRTGVWALNFDKATFRGDGHDTSWVFKDTLTNITQISDDSAAPAGSLWALSSDKQLWHGTVVQAPSLLEYQGGDVMGGVTSIFYIWYGNWSTTDRTILLDLASSLSGPYWNINSSYTDSSGRVPSNVTAFAGSFAVPGLPHGTAPDSAAVAAIVNDVISTRNLPWVPGAVYLVMAGSEVTTPGFCSAFCAYHSTTTVTIPTGGTGSARFALVLNPGARCSGCVVRPAPTPNGSAPADSAATFIAHEMAESVTDPYINAWFDPSFTGVQENGDLCAGSYGPTYLTANRGTADIKLGSRDFLLQRNWINTGNGGCGMSVP